ncbi:MAG: multiheme c-type cytochrome, partial [Myxococcota bacterium]
MVVLLSLPLAFAGLRGCLPPIGRPTAPPPVVEGRGAATCDACHAEQAAAWSRSTHARAESPVPPELAEAWSNQGIAPAPVRAIGVAPVVQFLVPFDGGRLQVTDRAWDPRTGEWFSVFADARSPGEWGHWTGGGMTWNLQCATCHSTGVVVGYDAVADRYATTALEHRVGCPACHGDVQNHAAGGPPPRVVTSGLDGCAPCHARRAELTGRWTPGEPFLDHFAPQLVDRSDAFWADGQVREEDFEYTAFVGSKMFAAGVVCTSCHDPHSGELVAEGDPLCLGCHAAQAGFVAHDRHAAGVGCVGCHLPVTTYMQRDPRHDHGFRVPDPALNQRFGIPDACTRCHPDQGPEWTAARAAEWYPNL